MVVSSAGFPVNRTLRTAKQSSSAKDSYNSSVNNRKKVSADKETVAIITQSVQRLSLDTLDLVL